MRYLVMVILLGIASFQLQANEAINSLNALLEKKEQIQHHKIEASKEIKDLSENYYFVFMYKSTCPHCHQFAPILKDFSDAFQIGVKSYSLDGAPLNEFYGKPLTASIFQTFYVGGGYKPTVPALFLVNRHTKEAYAVLFGEANAYQLARRVHELKKHIEEKFHA